MLKPARFLARGGNSAPASGAAGMACHDLRPAGPCGPPRCRSARSARAVSHDAGVERPDKLQAPSSTTDIKIGPIFSQILQDRACQLHPVVRLRHTSGFLSTKLLAHRRKPPGGLPPGSHSACGNSALAQVPWSVPSRYRVPASPLLGARITITWCQHPVEAARIR